MTREGFLRSVRLREAERGEVRSGHPWELPVVAGLAGGLELDPQVTYLIGENGSGKSTLLGAIAHAAGMSAEGGSSNFAFPDAESSPPALAQMFAFSHRAVHAQLGDAIGLVRGARRPRTDFFLRAESLFAAASYLEQLDDDALSAYGGISLHEQSHGQSFLAILLNRFGPNGLYLLDEPEAALSTQNCLTALRRIHELVQDGSQFIISTHSPLILAYPDATIYNCTEDGLQQVDYDDAEPVRLTSNFLNARERFVEALLEDS
jgi:predicted ATPase